MSMANIVFLSLGFRNTVVLNLLILVILAYKKCIESLFFPIG